METDKWRREVSKYLTSIGVEVKDVELVTGAFVHSSYVNEFLEEGFTSNERLEFLGDSVLSLAVSRLLYKSYPRLQEGELTAARARLVNKSTLASISSDLKLGEHLLLGKGELLGNGRQNPSMLADVLEALIGALYLSSDGSNDGGDAAFDFIEKHFSPLLAEAVAVDAFQDSKSRLQQITQARFNIQPTYELTQEEGQAHQKQFTVKVYVSGECVGIGVAQRKKDAEQAAALEALKKFSGES